MLNRGLISIGCNCWPRWYITKRMGLSKRGGYLTGPFDLVLSTEQAVLSHFQSRFANFLDGIHLARSCPIECRLCTAAPGSNPYAGEGVVCTAAGVTMVHESPAHAQNEDFEHKENPRYYVDGDFANLRARVEARIANMYRVIDDNESIVLVRATSAIQPWSDESTRALVATLTEQYPSKSFRVVSAAELVREHNRGDWS